jgi:hypothetical protein
MSKQDDQLKVLGCLAAFAYIPVLVLLSAFTHGWALTTLWRWFIVPTFGATPLTYLQAVGMSMTVRLMTYHVSASKEQEEKGIGYTVVKATAGAILYPVLTVGSAWLIMQFMK